MARVLPGLYGNTIIDYSDEQPSAAQILEDYHARTQAANAQQQAQDYDAQQRGLDRQQQMSVLGAQQQFAAQRDVYDAQQRAGMQEQSLAAAYQNQAMQQQEWAHERDQQAHQANLDWALRGYNAVEDRNQRAAEFGAAHEQSAQQFAQTQAQRSYEFNAGHQQQEAERQAQMQQRQYEFEQGRQPSDRDVYQRQAQDAFADRQAQLQASIHQQELSQAEQMRLNRLQAAKAQVMEGVHNGSLSQQEGNDFITQIMTGIHPLQERQRASMAALQEQRELMVMQQHAKAQAMDEQAAQFRAKNLPDRIAPWTDETGQVHHFFEESPGKFKQIDKSDTPAQRLRQQQDQFDTRRQDRLDKFRESITGREEKERDRWAKDIDHVHKLLDDSMKFEEDPGKLAAFRDSYNQKVEDMMKARGWSAGANVESFNQWQQGRREAASKEFQQQAGPSGPSSPPPVPTPPNRITDPGWTQDAHGNNVYDPNQPRPAAPTGPSPAAATPAPQAAAPAARLSEIPQERWSPDQRATMNEFSKLDIFKDPNNNAEDLALGKRIQRAQDLYEQYRNIQAMPRDAQQEFLSIMKDVKDRINRKPPADERSGLRRYWDNLTER